MENKLLHLQNVSFQYKKGSSVLDNISFSAYNTESIGLVGANGAGKSTLLKLIVGLYLEYDGQILADGSPVIKENLPKIREKTGYVFQDSDSQLFMSNTYGELAFAPRNYGLSEEEVHSRVNTALDMVGIQYLKNKPIYQMSGGEKKLVSIATIFSMTPNMILLDEPSVALDPKNRRNLIKVLNSLCCLKIIASHDLDLILDTCERTILLADGKIVGDGKTNKILLDKELLERYDLELPLSRSRG